MEYSKKKQFIIVFLAFLILGIPFKVMILIEGFTEVRPVNAIPVIAGLISGPIGAVACGLANVVADLFGTFNLSSILGLVGNAIAAYLPYRLWHIFSKEEPNLHKNINILKYIFVCFVSALTVSWILGFGLYYVFGQWIENVYTYVFFNNFGFSIGLGMPVFIMLSSDDVNIKCERAPKHYVLLKNNKAKKIIPIIYTIILTVIFISVFIFHISPSESVCMDIGCVLGAIVMICIII